MPNSSSPAELATTFCCPHCRSILPAQRGASLSCEHCQVIFPFIAGTIPILVKDPDVYIAGERQLIQHDAARFQATSDYYLQVAGTTDIRQQTLRELATGFMQNGKLLTELSEMLPAETLGTVDHGLSLGADLFASLRKDWSGAEETEAELQIAITAILEVLSQAPPQRTLVLGAGAGRVMCEIDAIFPGTVGIDLSSALATAFAKLCQIGQLTAYMLHQGNFLHGADECDAIHAHRELAAGNPHFVVADASVLPFPDGSFDTILANYFTDILALSKWLPEAKRVLAPGGQIIHFGPLGYAFPEIAEYYSVDQLSSAFGKYGFAISEPKFVRSSFYANRHRLNRFDLDNLLFTARPMNK